MQLLPQVTNVLTRIFILRLIIFHEFKMQQVKITNQCVYHCGEIKQKKQVMSLECLEDIISPLKNIFL